MDAEQITEAIREAEERGYPCSDPDCAVWECDITRAAQAALDAIPQSVNRDELALSLPRVTPM